MKMPDSAGLCAAALALCVLCVLASRVRFSLVLEPGSCGCSLLPAEPRPPDALCAYGAYDAPAALL